ncbi:MAG: 3-deoxy-D-manno-octulosonic acid transferase [Phycisphaerales bacterium]|nr:3-deoxy-D-manno-octulosonic acid transferase [Phycisphaerales bacterium]MCB9854863.1 3-deoxy-D-manno-octulosonic acid transferase [Phycisphaerales bacterium]
MPTFLVDLIYLPLALLYLPILLYQMIALKKNRSGWRDRFGGVPVRSGDAACVWIHGVSLGEINASRTLVEQLALQRPDIDIVISSTTDTGYAAAKRLYPDRIVFRYPLDISLIVRRTLNRIRPSVLVLMELELWPNLLRIASGRGIAVGVANGRITEEKSMRRFSLPIVRSIARDMVFRLAWIAAQEDAYADRFRRLGAPPDRVFVAGSLKYDTAVVADAIPGDDALAEAMGIRRDAPLLVAGSTGPGEEPLILDAYERLRTTHASLQLALIPRKPERFDEVARLIESRGFACRRRSLHSDNAPAPARDEATNRTIVFLGDTMGELRKFYALADAVFVGRTLAPLGGSDLMEVAALAKPLCYGPHIENFADIDQQLMDADAAIKVENVEELIAAFDDFVTNPSPARRRCERARDVVLRNQGATRKIVDLITRKRETP